MDDLIGAVFFLYMNYRNVSFHVLLVFTAIKDYCRDAGIISLLVFKAKKLIRQTKNKYRHTKHTATTTTTTNTLSTNPTNSRGNNNGYGDGYGDVGVEDKGIRLMRAWRIGTQNLFTERVCVVVVPICVLSPWKY